MLSVFVEVSPLSQVTHSRAVSLPSDNVCVCGGVAIVTSDTF